MKVPGKSNASGFPQFGHSVSEGSRCRHRQTKFEVSCRKICRESVGQGIVPFSEYTAGKYRASLLNSRQLKFCLSAVGIFGFLAFESSREALKDRSEDEVRHTD